METVLRQFKARGLLFLDSRTAAQSVGDQLAQELGVAERGRATSSSTMTKRSTPCAAGWAETEAVARRQGFAVAIGHPHEATIQALSEWLPTVAAKGFALAPLSADCASARLGLSTSISFLPAAQRGEVSRRRFRTSCDSALSATEGYGKRDCAHDPSVA